jgi:pimeloyl-ACP methyl ester carboxylesterase
MLDIGFEPEVPFRIAAELDLAERIARRARAGERAPELAAPGERSLVLPIGAGGTRCRVFIPAEAAQGPRPLVLVAHGMGGSEHLWFEAHGDGLVRRLCAERGWILAAPGFGLSNDPEIGAILAALEAFLPADRERVFLVGHSLGAMRIVDAAVREPKRYRALAPLSGNGVIPSGTRLEGLPCYLAAGDQDFGRGMSMALQTTLERVGAAVTFELFAPSDHLMMVVDSLPAVFRFFDAHAGAAQGAG